MVMSMRVIGLMIKLKDLEYILIWMVLNIKVNGKKTNNMVRVKNAGQMELYMKVNTV